jgi:hypothetical protein
MLQFAAFSLMVAMAPTDAGSVVAEPAPARVNVIPANNSITLRAEEWARPRSGQSVARLDALNGLVVRFNERAGQRIVIRYAGGDEGNLWAEELRAWLIALGVPSGRIELAQAALGSDVMIIETKTNGDTEH